MFQACRLLTRHSPQRVPLRALLPKDERTCELLCLFKHVDVVL